MNKRAGTNHFGHTRSCMLSINFVLTLLDGRLFGLVPKPAFFYPSIPRLTNHFGSTLCEDLIPDRKLRDTCSLHWGRGEGRVSGSRQENACLVSRFRKAAGELAGHPFFSTRTDKRLISARFANEMTLVVVRRCHKMICGSVVVSLNDI